MFCRECGNQIMDGSKFCPDCGTPVAYSPNKDTRNTRVVEEDGWKGFPEEDGWKGFPEDDGYGREDFYTRIKEGGKRILKILLIVILIIILGRLIVHGVIKFFIKQVIWKIIEEIFLFGGIPIRFML